MPDAGQRVWDAFWRLDIRRTASFGHEPVGPGDIRHWCALRNVSLKPWELDALDAMERARLDFLNQRKEEVEPGPTVSDRKMTPGLFKAVFG